jgi:hypothetical protein
MACVFRSWVILLLWASTLPAGQVLLVADELPAMQGLAARLRAGAGVASRLVRQAELPADLQPFQAVIVYLHGELGASAEAAFIDYTERGGKLIVVHHSISSGKRANQRWFGFLGVDLPRGDARQGGYQWIEPATITVVNLAPHHFITTNQVAWPERVAGDFPAAGGQVSLPAFTLERSEVYLNHVLTSPRTRLLGFKYTDPVSGQTWMQETAGWIRPAGKGWILYFLPGHSVQDFEHPSFGQILLNAVLFQPGA